MSEVRAEVAPFAVRASAFAIDLVLLVVFVPLAALILAEVAGLAGTVGWRWLDALASLAAIVVTWAGPLAYFTLTEGGERGQTLGKRFMSIRVTGPGAELALGYPRALLRTLVRVPSTVLLIGELWALWDRDGRTWPDLATHSRVVGVLDPAAPGLRLGEHHT